MHTIARCPHSYLAHVERQAHAGTPSARGRRGLCEGEREMKENASLNTTRTKRARRPYFGLSAGFTSPDYQSMVARRSGVRHTDNPPTHPPSPPPPPP